MNDFAAQLQHFLAHDLVSTSAVVGAAVAILVFVLTQIANIFLSAWSFRREKKRVVRGLYREISENVANLAPMARNLGLRDAIKREIIASALYRPLIIVNESSLFYDAMASLMPGLHSRCLLSLMRFYGAVRDERAIAAAVESAGFLTVTPAGRESLMDDLWGYSRLRKTRAGPLSMISSAPTPADGSRIFRP